MILFFRTPQKSLIAVETTVSLSDESINKINWLLGEAEKLNDSEIEGTFVGPRREMITPWSTTAVEITQIGRAHV